MCYPGSSKPDRIANADFEIQILDTLEILEPRFSWRLSSLPTLI
jgi:hypothetical protein